MELKSVRLVYMGILFHDHTLYNITSIAISDSKNSKDLLINTLLAFPETADVKLTLYNLTKLLNYTRFVQYWNMLTLFGGITTHFRSQKNVKYSAKSYMPYSPN